MSSVEDFTPSQEDALLEQAMLLADKLPAATGDGPSVLPRYGKAVSSVMTKVMDCSKDLAKHKAIGKSLFHL